MLKKWLREPLLHFLLIGAALFVLYGLQNDEAVGDDRRIVFTDADINRLVALWEKRWQRLPTQLELEGLIESQIREEVLYREALAMGLDQQDTVVRRRLAQKLEFITADLAAQAEPGDAELADFLAAHSDQFEVPGRISFVQVYLNADKRGEQVEQDAIILLDELEFLPAVGDQRFSHLLNDQKDESGVAPGLRRFVTIYGDGKLNLNTVEEVVLQTYFPQNPELSERIIDRRETASEEDEPSFSSDDESDTTGNPYTSVEQINEVEGVSAPTLQKNGVDVGLDFTTKSHYFSMRIIGETQTSRRDELFVIERVPGAAEGDAIEGFRLLLRQERTDILETLDAEE